MKTRILVCVLIALCLVLVWPNTVSAAPVASGDWGGGNTYWELSADGTLTLSGPRHMQGATNYDYPWKEYSAQIKKIVIKDGLTSIAEQAFSYMENLESVEISNTVKKIGQHAFRNCTRLSAITIPASVTEIGNGTFMQCSKLKTVNFAPGCQITTIETGLFMHCGLTYVKIPASVKEIKSNAFYGCENLEAVDLQEGVESIGSFAFYNCKKIATLLIPSTLTNIREDSFRGCANLTHLDLYTNVNYYNDFRYNPIASIEFHNNMETVLGFANCDTLVSVTMPDSVKTIGDSAFRNCPLTDIKWPKYLQTIGSQAFSFTKFTSVELPSTVVTVGSGAFSHCQNLTSFVCSSGMDVISPITFASCENLEIIDTGEVSSIGFQAFENCSGLKTIIWSENIRSIGYNAFESCTSLERIVIPESVVEIEHGVFTRCSALKEVVFWGDTPNIGSYIFTYVTATAYYPVSNTTWTEDVMLDYGGTITWIAWDCDGNHIESITPSRIATCTEDGLTEGTHCAACGLVIVAQRIIPATGHTEVIDAGKEATCTQNGLTQGGHCSACGKVVIAQETIVAGGHGYGAWNEIKIPTTEETGLAERICAVCGHIESKTLPKLATQEPESNNPGPVEPTPTDPDLSEEPTDPSVDGTEPSENPSDPPVNETEPSEDITESTDAVTEDTQPTEPAKQNPNKKKDSPWVAIGIGAAVVLIGSGMGGYLLIKRRKE